MAGRYPPPPPPPPRRGTVPPVMGYPPAPPPQYQPAAYGPGTRYGPNPYALPRRPPRRGGGVGAAVVGALGGLAAVFVVAILGMAAFGARHTGTDTGGGSGTSSRVSSRTATASKLYTTGALTPVACRLPRIVPGDNASMQTFMETLSGCLDRSWSRQFRKADMSFSPPDRVFWSAPGRSPCGSYPAPGAAAFYCPANNTMYVGLEHIVQTSGDEPVSHYAVYARVIAHEYGHHVQDRAGILGYGHLLMENSDIAVRNEASRRIELQAQCFAGLFLGTERGTLPMTREQYLAMILDVRARGDDREPVDQRDHGSGRNYAGWVEKGYQNRLLSACNTWTAPASQVD